jgi:hypothetical protein
MRQLFIVTLQEGHGKKQGKANHTTARAKERRGVWQGSPPKAVGSRWRFF